MKPYEIRATRLTIVPEGEPIFSTMATNITIEDEASGEYLRIEQQSDTGEATQQSIIITPEDWPTIKQAIETLMPTLRDS